MVASSVTLVSPPDGFNTYDARPATSVIWSGGVGPFNVRYEWDDNAAFPSPITVLNSSVTSPDSAVPTSDLGTADWYLRVTVIDTDDSGELQDPVTYHTLTFGDVNTSPRYLTLDQNIGVGFSSGLGDGDPVDNARYLILDQNIGVGFATGLGDNSPNDPPRFLTLDQNIDATQPCPFLEYITPTLQNQGGTVILTGTGFGALQTTYATEVRLHSSDDLGSPFVIMTASSWSEDEISVTVPSGGSTGWVAVVHTNVGATCPGSSTKLLQIVAIPADPDMGWFTKAVDKENNDIAGISAIPFNVTKSSFKKTMNAIGTGSIEIPLGDTATLESIIDPLMRKGTLIRSYINNRMRYGWFAEKLTHRLDGEGNVIARITGRGMEVVALWTKVGPNDYPASPSLSPTWQYGSNENLVLNPGFDNEATNPTLVNPGGEEGNDVDGNLFGWTQRGSNVTSFTSVNDAVEARTGDWYIRIDASDNHSGIEQSIPVLPNRVYHIQAYVKESTAAGMRVTLAIGGADDIAATATYPNNYIFNSEVMAELDNVARNPASNGCPGGSSDGTWQVLDVEVMTGNEQTSLTVAIQDDHHGVCVPEVHVPFYVDDVLIEGWGVGIEPWVAFDVANHASNSFRLVSSPTLSASPYALKLNPLGQFAGVEQVIAVNPGTTYTATIWAQMVGPLVDDYCRLVIRENDTDQTLIATTINQVPNAVVFIEYTVTFTTSPTTSEIIFRFAYTGPNNPTPIYVESASLQPGKPAAVAGIILNDVLDKMALSGKLTYLSRTWTATKDSKGVPWPRELSLDIEPTESLFVLLSRIVALGHEWEIVPTNFAEGNDTGFELNVFTARLFNSLSGVGNNWINSLDGPVINPTVATVSGNVVKTSFNVNKVMGIGNDGVWSEVEQFPFETIDIPALDPAPLGYKDSFGIVEDVISVSASDSTTVSKFSEARLIDEKGKELVLQVDMMNASTTSRPFLNFGVGDSVPVDMPPTKPNPPDDSTGFYADLQRVRAIQANLSGEGSDITFSVDIDRVVYEEEFMWLALIAQLTERAPSNNTGVGTGLVSGSTPSSPSSQAPQAASPHTHGLNTTQITGKTTSGDVSGTLPGPITVNKIKGKPISGTIPIATGPGKIVMVFDPGLNSWVPVEFDTSFASRFLLGGM